MRACDSSATSRRWTRRRCQRATARKGGRLWRLARGIDERRVTPERETKSISSETTFDIDTAEKEQLTRTLLLLCERVAAG